MKTQSDIRMLMRSQGITQKELARQSGVSESMLSLWMNEKQNLTETTLQRIAEVLESDVRVIKR